MKNIIENKRTRQKTALFLIFITSGLAIAGLASYGPISQDPSYHEFADYREVFNIPNFWNVLSNLPFIFIGMAGLYRCRAQHCFAGGENRISSILFFAGVVLTGLSSAYYHFQPDNWGLFWDRLSMSLTFMAFLSIIIGAFISSKLSRYLLVPLVFFGLFSVIYWIATEQSGVGDLRLYALTQFLPLFVILVIAIFWESESIKASDVVIIGISYGIAKLLEFFDIQIYQLIMISGHTLKHLAAGFSTYWVLRLSSRKQRSSQP